MNNNLESARRDYKAYIGSEVTRTLGMSIDDVHTLGFEDIANKIGESGIRRKYRRLAINLIEENLRDHWTDRPVAIELFNVGNTRELQDWQSVATTWEQALWALVSQGDS
jgi:hypothetical protein